jgi:hypothetical protein
LCDKQEGQQCDSEEEQGFQELQVRCTSISLFSVADTVSKKMPAFSPDFSKRTLFPFVVSLQTRETYNDEMV